MVGIKWGKQLGVFIVVCLFLSTVVCGAEVLSYKITTEPASETTVENLIELTVYNENTELLSSGSLNIARDTEVLSVKDSYGALEYTVYYTDDVQKVSFQFTKPLESTETRILTIETRSSNLIHREGYFEYLLVLIPAKDVPSFVHIFKLPKTAELISTEQGQDYLVVPSATITETDEYLLIEWREALHKDTPNIFLVRFNQPQNIDYWKWFGIVVLAILFGTVLGIIGNTIYRSYREKKALNATKILNEREKAVLQHVIKNPEVKQTELVRQLGYTKSNMSKILKRLEFRGLINVKKEGKIRSVTIGEQFKKNM